jgi:ankyrin repeat protein
LREPLYFYLYRNFPASLTQKLLPYIPKIAQLTNQDGQNALHTAALDVAEHVEYERHIVIDMFAQFFERGVSSHKKVSARYAEQLLAAGVNPLAKDKFGRTCIDYLFANGHVDAVRALFNDDIYADAVWRYRDVVGRNPLHLAVIHNLPSIIHLMIASAPHKAEFMEFLEANDNLGRKPADYISNKYPKMAPIGEITVTAFETAYTKATGKPVGWRTRS